MANSSQTLDATWTGISPQIGEGVSICEESAAKRSVDLLFGGLLLVASFPVWIAIAVAIAIEDRGPIFYKQERHGLGGRRITIRKFRTMVQDSDSRYGIRPAKEGDERITRVGRLLRSFGLDELPQVFSIVKGDMSFVGPRALAIGEIVEDGDGREVPWEQMSGFQERLLVRPGLTSLATVYLPKDASPSRKFRYDLLYLRRRCLALDLRLIALSFWVSLSGRWETREAKV